MEKGYETNDRELYDVVRKIETQVDRIYQTLLLIKDTALYQQDEISNVVDAAITAIKQLKISDDIRSVKNAVQQLTRELRPVLGTIRRTRSRECNESVEKIVMCITSISNIIQNYDDSISPAGTQTDTLGEYAWEATKPPDGTRRTKKHQGRS